MILINIVGDPSNTIVFQFFERLQSTCLLNLLFSPYLSHSPRSPALDLVIINNFMILILSFYLLSSHFLSFQLTPFSAPTPNNPLIPNQGKNDIYEVIHCSIVLNTILETNQMYILKGLIKLFV